MEPHLGQPNESPQLLTVTRVDATSEKGGTAVLSGNRVRYTPPRDFIGTDTLTIPSPITGLLMDLPIPFHCWQP